MKARENHHNTGNGCLSNTSEVIAKSGNSDCFEYSYTEKLHITKYSKGTQLKLFDIKDIKEEKRERREAKTTIEVIEGLFDLCLKNNNLTDDMSLKHNAIVYKIGKHKTSASSMIDRENMSYCHNEDVIGLENTENGELAFFYRFSIKKPIDSNYSYFAIALPNYGELRKHFVEYLRSDLKKCLNIVVYLNKTVENKDEIILLRKCITMLKQKMKHINKVYGNDSIENCQ